MKIVERVSSRQSPDRDGYIPGYAAVSIKSKYFTIEEDVIRSNNVNCKHPFEQIFDSYEPDDIKSANSMDTLSKSVLKVGKKITQEGIVLVSTSSQRYPLSMPIVSLKSSPIKSAKSDAEAAAEKDDKNITAELLLPSPSQ